MWEHGLASHGVDFYEFLSKLHEHLAEQDYDRVILTRFEIYDNALEDCHYEAGLDVFITQVEEYGYGWDAEGVFGDDSSALNDLDSNPDWTEGGNHSEVVYTPEWIHRLKGHEVSLCGAFDGECIEDMEIALQACDVEFERVEELIV
jgi:hypothetical protein